MAEPDRSRSQEGSRKVASPSDALTLDPLWDDWNTPPRIDRMPVLHLARFDGPLDQLLDPAERGRIDLAGLSPAAFADQLGIALARLTRHMELHCRADLIILGSRLLLLWSRSAFLGPSPPVGEARGGIVQPIAPVEVAALRAAADWLEARPQLGRDVFARPTQGRSPRVESYMALMEACFVLLEGRVGQALEEPVYLPLLHDFWTSALATRHMRAALIERPEGGDLLSFVPAMPDRPSRSLRVRAATAGTLMASLELAREGEVTLDQILPPGLVTIRLSQAPTAAALAGVASPAGSAG